MFSDPLDHPAPSAAVESFPDLQVKQRRKEWKITALEEGSTRGSGGGLGGRGGADSQREHGGFYQWREGYLGMAGSDREE